MVADGLRRSAGESGGFAARWGGDEFVLVVDAGRVPSAESVIGIINRNLGKAINRAHLPYKLSVATGYAVCTSSDDNPDELLVRADSMLYERKHEMHAQDDGALGAVA